jgi:Cft2 family RNA processing exonuclease
MPPRAEAIALLVQLVREALNRQIVPVLHLYPLGKSQEVTRILSDHGIGVLQHPEIYAISRVYQACGVDLGKLQPYRGAPLPGWAVITLPKSSPRFRLAGLQQTVSIAVTGWAAIGSCRRLEVDHAVALSDHADYDELIETVSRVNPAKVYCTHGPAEFVDDLRNAGWDAQRLEWSTTRAIG